MHDRLKFPVIMALLASLNRESIWEQGILVLVVAVWNRLGGISCVTAHVFKFRLYNYT